MIKRLIAWFRIPRGQYCYSGLDKSLKRCPYYREFWPTPEWSDHISYCRLEDYSDVDEGFDFLLHDQCKICDIKNGD